MKKHRIESIDILRGLVILIMALDHTRDYFHKDSFFFDPTDWHHTTPLLYFTRSITHICAPSFVFLSGVSAFLSGQSKTKKEMTLFLIKRGIWLIILEVTVVNFGWFFNFSFSYQLFQVIFTLGFGMICLAGIIKLPLNYILILSIILIGGHNLLDNYHIQENNLSGIIWGLLVEYKQFSIYKLNCTSAYPGLPWLGIMTLGYYMGIFFTPKYSIQQRNKVLLVSGIGILLLFIFFRALNGYGDPYHWSKQGAISHTFFSFVKVTKYPPSLEFELLTISFVLLFLRFSDNPLNFITKRIAVFGRVPMFFYLIHIYLIHLLAIFAAEATGYSWRNMTGLKSWVLMEPSLKGYGFSLTIVYVIWICIILSLYHICQRYDIYKRRNKHKWWLNYL